MVRLPAFIYLLLRNGSLSPRSPHYAQLRKSYLQGLEAYLPEGKELYGTAEPPSNWKAFGALLKASVFQRGGHLLHPDNHLYYIRIPKSGSTSIGKTLLQARFPGLTGLHSTQINLLSDVWICRRIDTRQLKQAIGFTAVRHPLHRLVSVYRDFFEFPRDDFFIYHGYLFNILPQQLSFGEFVRRISIIPAKLLDPHLCPQHYFIKPYRQNQLTVKVFRLEEPELLRAFLRENNLELLYENRAEHQYDYRDYYTSTTKQTALKMYADDCRVFGYGH